jgi:hypothetical protein
VKKAPCFMGFLKAAAETPCLPASLRSPETRVSFGSASRVEEGEPSRHAKAVALYFHHQFRQTERAESATQDALL